MFATSKGKGKGGRINEWLKVGSIRKKWLFSGVLLKMGDDRRKLIKGGSL